MRKLHLVNFIYKLNVYSMRKFLLQIALLLVFGGWCLSANAVWVLNQQPLTKPTEIQDGKYYIFRNVCSKVAFDGSKVLGTDGSYKVADEIKDVHVVKVVFGDKNPFTGEQMFYLQSYETQKWFVGGTGAWTGESIENALPMTFGLASKTTFPEFVQDNMPESIRGERVTMPEWIAAGGDESLSDPEIFPTNTSFNKEQQWKWRSNEYKGDGGDAITLLHYASDYTEGDWSKVRCIDHIWGVAVIPTILGVRVKVP